MKNPITKFLVLVLSFIATVANAQSPQVSTYFEKTSVGPKIGFSAGYQFIDLIEVGAFYQKAVNSTEVEETRRQYYEKEFYGAYFAYPIIDHCKTSLKFNLRTGVTNGENFLITPSLLANYHLLQRVSIGGGMGVRTFKPTWQAHLKIDL